LGLKLEKIKKIQAVHRVFRGDEELLQFFFHHKYYQLRHTPDQTVFLALEYSSPHPTLVKVALELMGHPGYLLFKDLLELDNEFFIRVVNALLYYKEIQIELDEEELC